MFMNSDEPTPSTEIFDRHEPLNLFSNGSRNVPDPFDPGNRNPEECFGKNRVKIGLDVSVHQLTAQEPGPSALIKSPIVESPLNIA